MFGGAFRCEISLSTVANQQSENPKAAPRATGWSSLNLGWVQLPSLALPVYSLCSTSSVRGLDFILFKLIFYKDYLFYTFNLCAWEVEAGRS